MVEVLNNAQQLIQSNKIKKSIDLLEPFEDEYPFADEDENYLNRYDSLLAYSYSQGKRFLESEKIIERGLKNSPDSADLLFTLTFVKLSMREYDLAREDGQRYLDIVKNVKCDEQIFVAAAHIGQLLNMLGVASRESGNLKSAEDYFKRTIEIDKSNHLSFLNLAHFYLKSRRREEAMEIIESGLESCSQIHELRMLLETVMSRPSVSACMIVKDEEKYLEKTSVKIRDFLGIYADAIGQISKNEKISVYIYDSSDRTPLHLYSVLKSDIVKFKSGKINSKQFNSKIEYVSLRDKDDMRSQIDIMTYVLDTALKSQSRKSTEFRYSGSGVNGLYLDGFGALFLVNNSGNFFDRNFVVLEYDLMRLSEQQFEIDNLLRFKETKSYSSQKERIDSRKKALKKQMDDYKKSIESYKKSFSTLLGNYGHTLRLVNQNEWLCVMTNWDESNRARRTDDILRSLIMRVKKRDVEQFASGKLSQEDFFKKISFTEY
ncbi:MAG: hypothetical protein IID12_06060 [Candidatus Marinimicrobia bacterium]|nr:hypothetical protein [Candidatus Neomarinimicrobiota bacterium]